MLKKNFKFILALIFVSTFLFGLMNMDGIVASDKEKKSRLKWHTFDQGMEAAKKEKKMLVIDFYTDWCHWCKVMDEETYGNEEVVEFAGKNTIMAKIDAETNEKFKFRDAQYSGRELSMMLGVRGFPATVFFDHNGELITSVSGFIPAENFLMILKFLSGNWYEKMKFDEFVKKQQEKSKN